VGLSPLSYFPTFTKHFPNFSGCGLIATQLPTFRKHFSHFSGCGLIATQLFSNFYKTFLKLFRLWAYRHSAIFQLLQNISQTFQAVGFIASSLSFSTLTQIFSLLQSRKYQLALTFSCTLKTFSTLPTILFKTFQVVGTFCRTQDPINFLSLYFINKKFQRRRKSVLKTFPKVESSCVWNLQMSLNCFPLSLK
jgi:hypothetical protein